MAKTLHVHLGKHLIHILVMHICVYVGARLLPLHGT